MALEAFPRLGLEPHRDERKRMGVEEGRVRGRVRVLGDWGLCVHMAVCACSTGGLPPRQPSGQSALGEGRAISEYRDVGPRYPASPIMYSSWMARRIWGCSALRG